MWLVKSCNPMQILKMTYPGSMFTESLPPRALSVKSWDVNTIVYLSLVRSQINVRKDRNTIRWRNNATLGCRVSCIDKSTNRGYFYSEKPISDPTIIMKTINTYLPRAHNFWKEIFSNVMASFNITKTRNKSQTKILKNAATMRSLPFSSNPWPFTEHHYE